MARCELSGKGPVVKNLVSHSNIKTKSRAFPNVQTMTVYSNALDKGFRFKVAASTLRTIEHKGGFDTYILGQDDFFLSKRAARVKSKISKKLSNSKISR